VLPQMIAPVHLSADSLLAQPVLVAGIDMAEPSKAVKGADGPAPAHIDVRVGKKVYRIGYEQAFSLACSLLEKGQFDDAAKLFERLQEFSDRGPRAQIMQAFCLSAALHFDDCGKPLAEGFNGDKQQIAAELHNAFVSYHVGIRQDALKTMIELVNKYHELPTLCLLLGDMFETAGQSDMARQCWALAVRRDRPGGAVAVVARNHLNRPAEPSNDRHGSPRKK
jgi:hypothetical protein